MWLVEQNVQNEQMSFGNIGFSGHENLYKNYHMSFPDKIRM